MTKDLFDSRLEQEGFPIVLRIQKDPGIYQASCSLGKVAVSSGIKRAESKAEHSSPTSDEIKNAWSCNFTPVYAFMFSTGENLGVLTFTPVTSKLNSSAQRCLARFFTGDFVS
jgi:hypothetical protein